MAEMVVTVVLCNGPRQVIEHRVQLPMGSTVTQALEAVGASADGDVGVWGRVASPDAILVDGDRVEQYRPLQVDPKTARRERFARQGSRAAGLFKRRVSARTDA